MLIAAPHIWIPAARPLWRPPAIRRPRWFPPMFWPMADGDITLDTSGNAMVNSSGALKIEGSNDCCCGDPCTHCSGTPARYSVTFASLSGCSGCYKSASSCRGDIFLDRNLTTSGVLSGTYTLVQRAPIFFVTAPANCVWGCTDSFSIDGHCSVTAGGTCSDYEQTGTILEIEMARTATGFVIMAVGGRDSGSSPTQDELFRATITVAGCSGGPYVFTNIKVTCGHGSAGSTTGMNTGGTATATPL